MPPKRKAKAAPKGAAAKKKATTGGGGGGGAAAAAGAASDSDSDSDSDDADQRVDIVKGRAAVDNGFPGKQGGVPRQFKAEDYHVLDEGTVYDCMMNQTEISQNANKFFIVQVLKSDGGSTFIAWARWGRVGENGQSSFLYGPGPDKKSAIQAFSSKRAAKSKKYTILKRDYGPPVTAGGGGGAAAGGKKKKGGKGKAAVAAIPKSKLDKKVQEFVKLIADVKMMEAMMTQLGYDANKLPLGKLSKETIDGGYEVLKEISALLNGRGRVLDSVLQDLSSQFYTVVPHSFGRKLPPVLKTKQQVKEKLDMCAALADIQVAQKILQQVEVTENPIDACYEKLNLDMKPLKKASKEFKMLQEYVKNTHGATHSNYTLEIEDAFAIAREGEEDRFKPYEADANRQLLWHGSRLSNYVGILSQGLRIAPPEAPVTGYMFDKGVYFADCVSKSANYCFSNRLAPEGVMLLCEVALGDQLEMKQSDYYANSSRQKAGKQSVKGLGRQAPDDAGAKEVPNGVKVPCGKIVKDDSDGRALAYNEFIVYDTAQIKMRYALKMKFGYN